MRRLIVSGILISLAIGPWQAVATADGGTLRLVERHGAYRISVFTAPAPLRTGPVDISVLVQDASTGQPIDDARIVVRLTPQSGQLATMEVVATRDAATNKLMQAALVELATPGRWHAAIDCRGPQGNVDVHFEMDAGPRLPRWLAAWPWFSWPGVVVLMFAISRWKTKSRARFANHRSAPESISAAAQRSS